MAEVISVLVASATPGFGELIQQTLEETGLYKVLLIDSGSEALDCMQSMPFSLAILDSFLPDVTLPQLISEFKKISPAIHLVVIPPNNDPSDPELVQAGVHGFLTKPFYLPDLLDTVSEALHQGSSAETQTPPQFAPLNHTQGLDWLQDVSRAAQHLTRLSLESSAQAALIVRDGQLWAYAGQLAQPAAQEMAAVVTSFWANDAASRPGGPSGDMVRLVRLDITAAEYMLYATALGKGMVLALAFNAETPFSKIRTQASQLARALASPPGAHPVQPRPDLAIPLSQLPPPPNIKPLLEDVPPPSPSRRVQEPISRPRPDLNIQLSASPQVSAQAKIFPSTEAAAPVIAPAPALPPKNQVAVDMLPASALPQPQPAASPAPVEAQDESLELRPISPGLHNLVYACVLIPRLPQHYLTGDLGARLGEWIPQLCLAYGWRLDHIAVRPDYIEWVAGVAPTTSPSYLMRVLRQQTSQRIFADFPNLGRENPSGDFWAPGYLIMSSPQPPPAHVIREFIQQTRHHQGASRPPDLPRL
ncbi:MAG TPA: transposase [Anaerolineales bacterium]|nr:transposase [Anaerolineales bacterium]